MEDGLINSIYRGIDCPVCGYTVHLCIWTVAEIKSKEGALGFCDMCESYLRFKEVDGRIISSEDFEE